MGLGWFFQISQSLAELDQSHCFNQIRLGCDHPGAIHFLDLVSMWPSGETGIFGSALVSTPGEPWPPDTSTTKKLWNVLTSISSTAVFGKTWGEVTEGLLEQDARPLPWSSFLQTAVRRCPSLSIAVLTWSFRVCWCPLASAKFLHWTPPPGLEAATVPSLPTESSKISEGSEVSCFRSSLLAL